MIFFCFLHSLQSSSLVFVHFTIFFKFRATTSRPAITSMIHRKVETAKTTPSSSHRGIGEIFLKEKVPLFCRGGEASSGKLIIIRGSGPVSGERIWKKKKSLFPNGIFASVRGPVSDRSEKEFKKKKEKLLKAKAADGFSSSDTSPAVKIEIIETKRKSWLPFHLNGEPIKRVTGLRNIHQRPILNSDNFCT